MSRLLAIPVLLLALACGDEPPALAPCTDCNIVLVLADTLRADHLASYGYERITSPELDRLAADSVQFLQARSQAACTFPSVNSLLTSRYPSLFLDPGTQPAIPDHVPSIARVLGRHGYHTEAVSASPIVRKSPSDHNPRGGFDQGFDRFDESVLWRDAREVSRAALRSIDRMPEPFFLYLHYMDPHDPYAPGDREDGIFAGPYRGELEFVAAGDANPVETMVREGRVDVLSADDVTHLVDLYDEAILTFDAGLRRLLAGLETRELDSRTVVVVMADHGEAFLEHGTIKHCHGLHDPEIRVPLLLRAPGLDPREVAEPVENVDLVPTLLDLLGLSTDGLDFDGQSLLPLALGLETTEGESGRAYSAMGSLRSVNDARHKLIHDLRDGSYELFDLEADPEEKVDLLEQRRGPFPELRRDLDRWLEETEGGISVEERLRRAREVDESLRALGYLG